MADKDFAHSETLQCEGSRDRPATKSKAIPIVILALIFAIASFAVGFFIGEKYALETSKGDKQEILLKTLKEQQKEIEAFKKEARKWQQIEANTLQVGELTFYNELPKQSVMPEPINAPEKPITAKHVKVVSDNIETEKKLNTIIEKKMNTSTPQFRIQLASHKQRKYSEDFVAQLKKIGIEAEVHQVNLANLGIRYRVRTLPFKQREHALRTKKLVKEKFHITGILISE